MLVCEWHQRKCLLQGVTDAIERELLVTQPALKRMHAFLSKKANNGEKLKAFIEKIIISAELAYLETGLTKNDLIIMVSLMGVNEPMRVKNSRKILFP